MEGGSRKLVFAESFSADSIKLFELDSEDLLDELKRGELSIKGHANDEAILCSSDRSFTVRLAESTNTLLLIPSLTGKEVGAFFFFPSFSHFMLAGDGQCAERLRAKASAAAVPAFECAAFVAAVSW